MVRSLANTYDALELWVTQLTFPLQVLLAVLVVVPLCLGVAVLLDRGSELLAARIEARRRPG